MSPRQLLPWIFPFVILWMFLTLIPASPLVFRTGLDASWVYGLNMAHAQNLVFGRDVVFTFGPLGYLIGPIPGLAEPFSALAFAWSIPAVFLCGAWLIWRALGHHWIVLASWVALASAMLLTNLPHERMRLAFLSLAIGTAAVLGARDKAGEGCLVLVGAVAGLMLLVKSNEGVSACVVFFGLLATWLLTLDSISLPVLRRLLLLSLVPLVALIGGFVWVERNISDLGVYVTRSLAVALGYSEAMSQPGPAYEAYIGIVSLMIIGLVIPLLAGGRRDLLKGLLSALSAGFFIFKSSMVRQDTAHASALQINLAIAGLFLLVCARTRRDRWLVISYVAVSFCYGTVVHLEAFPSEGVLAERRALLWDLPANLSDNWHWGATWARVDKESREALDSLRVDAAITRLVSTGTVDDLPVDIDFVIANGWKWKPRPVFQSYSAYTPALDELNARHLASPDSADHIIMHWGDIDGKHPLLDDPASWRALFNHYDVELTRPDLLVLKRRESTRYGEPRPIGSATAGWQSDIAVPDAGRGQLTILSADVGRSLYGRLLGLLLRNSPTFLNATYSSGIQYKWRMTRANLVDGALISYLPETVNKVLPYFGKTGDSPPDRVVSIRFETDGPAEFSSAIRISWYALATRSNELPLSSEAAAAPAVKFSRLGVFRQPGLGGLFVLDTSSERVTGPAASKFVRFGGAVDIPVAGDWDGTGVVRIGVYRPATGHWYLDTNNNGKWEPGTDLDIQFGVPSAACAPGTVPGLIACPEIPIVGDWTGTGVSKLGIFRGGHWFLDKKNPRDPGPHTEFTAYKFGEVGDLPVAANWNHTGTADQIGVYRRGVWYVDTNGDGVYESNDAYYTFGSPGDFPVTGNWSKGGKTIGVMNPSGHWYLDTNGDHVFTLPFDSIVDYGQPGDLPVVGGPWTIP